LNLLLNRAHAPPPEEKIWNRHHFFIKKGGVMNWNRVFGAALAGALMAILDEVAQEITRQRRLPAKR
jgi:hypothetical protein